MGTEELHTEAAQQETEESASYSIISFPGAELPDVYKGMVYSRWLRSHRYGNYLFKMIDRDVYYDTYTKYIEVLLANPDSKVRLAVLTDDHDVALAFSVSRGKILDYVHVHHTCRMARIATHLTPEKISCITHYTYMGARFATNKYGGFKFNPFA